MVFFFFFGVGTENNLNNNHIVNFASDPCPYLILLIMHTEASGNLSAVYCVVEAMFAKI